MGAKAWFIAYFDGDPKRILARAPTLDRKASRELADRLFPKTTLTDLEDGSLSFLCPDDDEVQVGCYPNLKILAHLNFAVDRPSRDGRKWARAGLGRNIYSHAEHSVNDWFAFSLWRDGKLVRSLSLSPDSGVLDNVGAPLPFEKPFWAGKHALENEPGEEPYPFRFHPLDLAAASLRHHLGFQFEGFVKDWTCNPDAIPIARYAIGKMKSARKRKS